MTFMSDIVNWQAREAERESSAVGNGLANDTLNVVDGSSPPQRRSPTREETCARAVQGLRSLFRKEGHGETLLNYVTNRPLLHSCLLNRVDCRSSGSVIRPSCGGRRQRFQEQDR